ncbi:MAG: hypothetical protein JZU65_08180 [Chlorobium sp.]|nr:hypothetical protein [Chlorobium sp.]
MHKMLPLELVKTLKSDQLGIRTGVLLLSDEYHNLEAEIAVYLGIGHKNICSKILEQTPLNKKLLGINRTYIFDTLDEMVKDESIPGRCILISGIDILLAALTYEEVLHFWDFFRDHFRRARGILISFPKSARLLLPLDKLNRWNEIERIALWEEPQNVL